jgi:hypothetical protein
MWERAFSVYYSVYGLRLRSNLPIPGLDAVPPSEGGEVRVWFDQLPPWLDQFPVEGQRPWYVSPYLGGDGKPLLTGWSLAGGTHYRLRLLDGVEFVVDRSGTQVWATWPPTLMMDEAVSYLLGFILAFVLRRRGTVCLHASAVAVAGRAVALLGPDGAGKSTTAAALAARGHAVVCDDLIALSEADGTFIMQPGFPWLRLRSAGASALRGALGTLPRFAATWDGRHFDLPLSQDGYRFWHRPLSLAAVYLLDHRTDDPAAPLVEPISGGDGFMALLANTWATCLPDPEMPVREFAQLGGLAASVPLRRVRPHADAGHLSKLCDVILDDYQAVHSTPGTSPGFAAAH